MLDHPQQISEQTDTAFWDAQWHARDQRRRLVAWLHGREYGPDGAFLHTLAALLGTTDLTGQRVCEIGGAESRICVDMARLCGAHVTALDYSPVGVAATRRLFHAAGVAGDVVLADVFDWTPSVAPFDVVTHWGVLEHFRDPGPLMQASARLVRPGGLVLFCMPALDAATVPLWRRYAPENFAAHVYHSDTAVEAACAAAGLTLERVVRRGLPSVRMAPVERRGLGGLAVNALHTLVLTAGRLWPGLADHVPHRWRSYRYFAARRNV